MNPIKRHLFLYMYAILVIILQCLSITFVSMCLICGVTTNLSVMIYLAVFTDHYLSMHNDLDNNIELKLES